MLRRALTRASVFLLPSVFLLAACEPQAPPGPRVAAGVVRLEPLAGRAVQGNLDLTQTTVGLVVTGDLTGLRGPRHVLRVHRLGDCSDPRGRSAGPAYAFRDAASDRQVDGTMLTLRSDETGEATLDDVFAGGRLGGPNSLLGRAVVVHRVDQAAGEDPTEARVACGVIGIAAERG